MLSVLGNTSIDDHFAFHDDPAKCSYSGGLTSKPGIIFVR
jgi:hypothetical protein